MVAKRVSIRSRFQSNPTVGVHARNRKTGEHASRTYENVTPEQVIRALDRALLSGSVAAQGNNKA